jgi:hypothetical protein
VIRPFIVAGAALLFAVCIGCDGTKSGDPKPAPTTNAPAGLRPAGRSSPAGGAAPATGPAKSAGAVNQP